MAGFGVVGVLSFHEKGMAFVMLGLGAFDLIWALFVILRYRNA